MYVPVDPKDEPGRRETTSEITLAHKVPAMVSGEIVAPGAPLPMEDGVAASPEKKPSLSSILRFKWTMLAIFVLAAGPAIAAIWTLTVPEYQAQAEVRVRPIIPRLVFSTEDNGMIPLYQSFMNTQVSIMRSPTVLQRVLDQEDVQQTRWFKDPTRSLLRDAAPPMERLRDALRAFPRRGTEIIDVKLAARSARDAKIIVSGVLDQYIKYIYETSDETRDQLYRQLTEQYKSFENEISGREKVLAKLRKELGTSDPVALIAGKRVRLDNTEAKLSELQREILVLEMQQKELDRFNYLRDISERESDRFRYIRYISEMSDEMKRQLERQLATQHTVLKNAISASEKKLTELKKVVGNADAAGASLKNKAQIDQIQARLAIVRRESMAVQWRWQELKKLVVKLPDEAKPSTRPVAHRKYHEDAEWRQLDRAVKAAQHNMEMTRKRIKESHPAMIDLTNELKFTESLLRMREGQLDEQWSKALNLPLAAPIDAPGPRPPGLAGVQRAGLDYQVEPESVKRQLRLLAHQQKLLLAEVEKQRVEFVEIFASAQLLEKENTAVSHKRRLFKAVQERLDHKEMERNVPGSIEVLTRAFAPSKPSKDRRMVFTIMALVGALGLSVGVAFLRASQSQAMHGAEDLPSPLRMPFLGQLPLVRKTMATFEDSPVMVESMRMVRTALMSSLDDSRGSAILISSAHTGAGKSCVAVMLAQSLAQAGKNVLLMDADLRKMAISKRFGLADGPGLIESLRHRSVDAKYIFQTDTPGLSILPAGQRSNGVELELTANGAFTDCIAQLRRDYDVVLLDTPPILPVADARILSRQVDGTIMVIRQETCRREEVVDALACLSSSGGKLIGTIFIGSQRRGAHQQNYYDYSNNGNGAEE